MTYSDQFPDFPETDLPPIPEGFTDQSWANDPCPTFYNAAERLAIWVDYADPDKREFPELGGRFQLGRTDQHGAALEWIGSPTDDWRTIELLIAVFRA